MGRLSMTTIYIMVSVAMLVSLASSAEAQTLPPCSGLVNDLGAIGRPTDISCNASPETYTAIGTTPAPYVSYTATLSGGVLTGFYGYGTRDTSKCNNNSLSPEINIEFNTSVSSVGIELWTRVSVPITYTMTDNLGRTTKLALAAERTYPYTGSMGLRGPGITSVRITADSQSPDPDLRWYFSIWYLGWTPESSPCQCDSPPPMSSHRVSGHDWTMDVDVSANDGLVLHNVTLGPRYLAKEMSVPYYVLQTSVLPLTRGELKRNGTDATARSRLVRYHENTDAEKLAIDATYAIDNIPAGSGSCLEITQRYEFYRAGTGCEPSDTLPCARFKPVVEYKFYGQGQETLTSINVVQRDYFQVDGRPGNTNGIFRDCESPIDPFPVCELSVIAFRRNPLLTEYVGRVVEDGNDTGVWDNFHQTYLSIVEEPALLPPNPGCEECVHIHWRWGRFAANPTFGGGPAFGDPPGHPLIPRDSHQAVDFAITRWHADEQDPQNYSTLVLDHPEPLVQDVVFWYSATGYQSQDAFFTHGGFFNPSSRNERVQSGPVAITYFNFFAAGPTTVNPIDPISAGVLPTGYVPYNNLAYDIATQAVVSGPYTASFTVPAPTDQSLLPKLRVLHTESGVLVDRTNLSANTPASRFTINAVGPPGPVPTVEIGTTVDSLGKFVIALLINRPPIARCKDVIIAAGDSGTASISASDLDDGSVDPDADSTTLSVDSIGPFSPGTHNVTLTVSDSNGASSSCSATVTVEDRTPPSITTCATDKTLSAGSNCQATTPDLASEISAADNYTAASSLVISQAPSAGTLIGLGPTTVTITVKDAAGNMASCAARVVVSDTAAPSIIAPANATFQCLSQVPPARATDATATDNCGAATVTVSESSNGGAGSPGSPLIVIRTYTGIDAAGNSASTTQTIMVIDNTPPSIACPSNIIADHSHEPGQCSAVVSYTVTAVDNCSAATVVCAPPAGSVFPEGATTVSCTANDAASNTSSCSFTVTVIPSQLTILSPAMVWLGLKNSDDVGTKFDLLAEVLKNGTVVSSGQVNDVPGGSSGFNNAVLRTIDLTLSAPVDVCAGDTLSFRLSVRIAAASSHRAGTARLWFNDAAANSRFGANIGGSSNSYYLTGLLLSATPGPGPKSTSDVVVDRAIGGNPFKPFGMWSVTF